LDLPHVFLGSGQFQAILDQAREPTLLDLAGYLHDEPVGRIFQHHRLQREAPLSFSALDQRTAAQRLHGVQHLGTRERRDQHRQQILDAHRLAQDGQPEQHRLLDRREASELFGQQLAHTAKDHLALLQERRDLASEKINDGLRHDFERQWVARVQLDQPLPVWGETDHFSLCQ